MSLVAESSMATGDEMEHWLETNEDDMEEENVKEIVRAALSELAELGRKRSGMRVPRELKEYGILTIAQLRRYVSSCRAKDAAMREACTLELESIAPEVLREFADRKLRERAQAATIVGHR
ncbi:unnamed protein product [Heligmosomoides polygyrus]|uniref:EF-hand domain-containing protein n=1 Tax=Heligmosomoides polygyrus TaxID=6339 RepID=A0A183G0S6_HELPZ|nr:unnamed protein product [Heligmosomoides polygyrus]